MRDQRSFTRIRHAPFWPAAVPFHILFSTAQRVEGWAICPTPCIAETRPERPSRLTLTERMPLIIYVNELLLEAPQDGLPRADDEAGLGPPRQVYVLLWRVRTPMPRTGYIGRVHYSLELSGDLLSNVWGVCQCHLLSAKRGMGDVDIKCGARARAYTCSHHGWNGIELKVADRSHALTSVAKEVMGFGFQKHMLILYTADSMHCSFRAVMS